MAPPKKAVLLGAIFVFLIYRIIVASREEESLNQAELYETKEGTWLYLNQRILLHTVFRTDPNSVHMLAHFLNHYLRYGFQPGNIYITLQGDGSKQAIEVLRRYNVNNYHTTNQEYTDYLLYLEYTTLLNKAQLSRTDWIVFPDMEDLVVFPSKVDDYVSNVGINSDCVVADIIDRFPSNGSIQEVEATPSIWAQYPLECDLTRAHARMLYNTRVVMHRGGGVRTERVFEMPPLNRERFHPESLADYRFAWTPFNFARWKNIVTVESTEPSHRTQFFAEIVRHVASNKNRFCVECGAFKCHNGFDPEQQPLPK
eukprot:TRINITY_DN10807_c0_g1_i1.p1 TRINITY_DN10807_c0_g1~~TRINITY_DN10807_c0_g1_i1.p1  ORF type:complete len:313 (+),score=45.66 TRINITY_DN10807_c0_g1_i1:249-1187(+)